MIVAEGEGELALGSGLEVRLQWGRNLIVAEGTYANEKRFAQLLLQWGRNLIVAEGSSWAASSGVMGFCFNGAAT